MGLIRGIARTAVVAGTATAVSNRVSRRQQARWSDQQQAEAAPPPPDDLSAQLNQLSSMRQSGQLSDEEFAAAKAKLLGI
jgi:hypothetical protein